jgi:hypothetical protein
MYLAKSFFPRKKTKVCPARHCEIGIVGRDIGGQSGARVTAMKTRADKR